MGWDLARQLLPQLREVRNALYRRVDARRAVFGDRALVHRRPFSLRISPQLLPAPRFRSELDDAHHGVMVGAEAIRQSCDTQQARTAASQQVVEVGVQAERSFPGRVRAVVPF
jgi:hypothetical protein